MLNAKIGFIGAGNMAGSLIQGLLAQGTKPELISAADIDADRLATLSRDCGIVASNNDAIATSADIIVLAVKPQVMQTVCSTLPEGQQQPLFMSVAAGITLDQLQDWLPQPAAVVRCMPNTPALIGCGASGLFANAKTSATQREAAETLMSAVGLSVWVDREELLDVVTAVSGSGPAYYFLLMEAMQQSAVTMGLDETIARDLVLQTALGAAELARQSEVDTAELRRRVTSPGGTTERAIATFERGGLQQLVAEAMEAARRRSLELATEAADDPTHKPPPDSQR